MSRTISPEGAVPSPPLAAGFWRVNLLGLLMFASLIATPARSDPPGYNIFVQHDWIMSTKGGLSRQGNLVFRRYGYRQDLRYFPNLVLFTCQKSKEFFNYMTIVVPKDYPLKSFARDSKNAKLSIRIMTDGRAVYNLTADYNAGEMAIDRTPDTSTVFDLIMDARELSIGFGVGDIFRFYSTDRMDAFLKDASVAAGFGSAEVGDISFIDRLTAYKLCTAFQSGG